MFCRIDRNLENKITAKAVKMIVFWYQEMYQDNRRGGITD